MAFTASKKKKEATDSWKPASKLILMTTILEEKQKKSTHIILFACWFLFVVMGVEPRVLCLLGKHSTTELHLHPRSCHMNSVI